MQIENAANDNIAFLGRTYQLVRETERMIETVEDMNRYHEEVVQQTLIDIGRI